MGIGFQTKSKSKKCTCWLNGCYHSTDKGLHCTKVKTEIFNYIEKYRVLRIYWTPLVASFCHIVSEMTSYSSSYTFHAIWLVEEKFLHFNKVKSRNPSDLFFFRRPKRLTFFGNIYDIWWQIWNYNEWIITSIYWILLNSKLKALWTSFSLWVICRSFHIDKIHKINIHSSWW